MKPRGSGILCHISSLPSECGIGDFGPSAYRVVDFLRKTKQRYWQILPLTPTDSIFGNSPYSSPSAFAGNILFISPQHLMEEGWLKKTDLQSIPLFSLEKVDYGKVYDFKRKILESAFQHFLDTGKNQSDFKYFCAEQNDWLKDHALFTVLHKQFSGAPWNTWPKEIRERQNETLKAVIQENFLECEQIKFFQYLFYKQWSALKSYCQKNQIKIIGDIPIFVNFNSADVWTHPDFFKLDKDLNPKFVAGVPPDYFSKSGQRWGNPVYNWRALRKDKYSWWMKRIEHNLRLYDYIRIDHFRGFAAYWQIPAYHLTAEQGRWVKVSGADFFKTLLKHSSSLPIIAEDLGYITEDVKDLIKRFQFPGMRVLLFGFSGDLKNNDNYPPHYIEHCIAYTGTHDNNTIKGWFLQEANNDEKEALFYLLGKRCSVDQLNWELIEMIMKSSANTVIIPMQDILGLGNEARMNIPGTTQGNWQWRLTESFLTQEIKERLLRITQLSLRT